MDIRCIPEDKAFAVDCICSRYTIVIHTMARDNRCAYIDKIFFTNFKLCIVYYIFAIECTTVYST